MKNILLTFREVCHIIINMQDIVIVICWKRFDFSGALIRRCNE